MNIPIWVQIILAVLTLGGVYWALREDYIDLESVKNSLGLDELRDMVINAFTRPVFIFIYLIFVLFPVWVITDYVKAFPIPLWQKLLLSVAGIWMVNQIMIAKDLE